MEYIKKLIELHEVAGEILEKILTQKKIIESLEQSQKQVKKTFGRTSPQIAHEILVSHRKIKMLSRGYSKINKQINL